MPIKVQSDLPARRILEKENIFVMTEKRAASQDIRPLKIAIVNLMPTKEATETQLLRLLGNTPLQIDISLVRMEAHESTHVSGEHLEKFYIPSSEIFRHKYDGMIITGAPVEQMPFEQVDYWDELCKIMDYAKENVFSTLYICWGAQAGLYHNYGIQKQGLPKKLFGILPNHRVVNADPLMRGFDDIFPVPTSRHTTVDRRFIEEKKDLVILAENSEGEVTLSKSKDNRSIFMMGHLEYDTDTLAHEYWRDKKKNLPIDLPQNYFPGDDETKAPVSSWRSTAHLFYSNWLNYYVYQETPYDLASSMS
ncbi:homoserine O-succinyltransferase [Treponema sp.]|uniref:homoserine O-succinyltransferase n=1 Tax=Treponema sp. TaxID=166 RepID=UPI0025EE5D1C|nr:homoserine O-succinyltransferase [Treponema sp.]MBR4321611.1 homoserine O-succinyltransferase [Treponema sp.]